MSDSKKNPTKELAALRRVRNVYGAEAEREKRRLIDALAAAPPRNAAGLAHYHDDLLFIRAFPGDPETLKRAARALGVVERAFMKTPAKDRAAYNESGMTGAKTHHAFPYPLARWLARRAPSEAEFDWRAFDAARLELLLRLLMRANEREGFDSGEFTTRAWIKAARRVDAHSDLQWIVEALAAAPKAQQAAIEEMWTAAEPDIVWNLAGSRYSATRYMLAGAPVVMRRAMRKPPPDPARHIAKPLASVERLEPKRARAVIEAARVAISSRDREVTAMTSA
ncbi:MAG TPA: hypothetical protein VNH64_10875, partial [Parvularculaceae bacterium]|nr:hypothetical protein [Parvularculaceae bacterium]